MKNFLLYYEQVMTILNEARGNILHSLWEAMFRSENKIDSNLKYQDMSDEQKRDLNSYKEKQQKLLDKYVDKYDSNTQTWIINVFKTGQQLFKDEDLEKICNMIDELNDRKKRGFITSNEGNLNKLNFTGLSELLAKTEIVKTNYGKNKIIKEDGDWKIIKLEKYDDAKVLIDNNQNSWCVKKQHNFEKSYDPPYYAFYKQNKPYALLNISIKKKSPVIYLKDVHDDKFTEIEPEFETQMDWLLFKYLKLKEENFDDIGDMEIFLKTYPLKYYVLFKKEDIRFYAKRNNNLKLYYKIIEPHEHDDTIEGKLHRAIVFDDNDVAIQILDSEKDIHLTQDKHFGLNSWFISAIQGNTKLIQKLLKETNVSVNDIDINGNSALILSCLGNHYNVVKILLEQNGLNFNIVNKNGLTAIVAAVETVNLKLVKELLKYGDKIDFNIQYHLRNDNLTYSDVTPTMLCCMKGYERIFKELLVYHEKINLMNAHHFNNRTPLHYACYIGKIGIVKELLKYEHHSFNRIDKYSQTPLMIACEYDHTDIVKEFLKHSDKIDFTKRGHDDKNILMLSYRSNIIIWEELLKVLINVNFDFNQLGGFDTTILYILSLYENNNEKLELLLKYASDKIDFNITDTDRDRTALLVACYYGNYKNVQILLKYGDKINFNIRDKDGYTSLMMNIAHNDKDAIIETLKYIKNFDLNIKDNDGKTALDHAKRNNLKDIENLLIKFGAE